MTLDDVPGREQMSVVNHWMTTTEGIELSVPSKLTTSLYIYYFSQYRSLLSLNKPPPGITSILSVRLVVAAVVVCRIISTHAVDHNQPTRVQSRASHSESKVGCKKEK